MREPELVMESLSGTLGHARKYMDPPPPFPFSLESFKVEAREASWEIKETEKSASKRISGQKSEAYFKKK